MKVKEYIFLFLLALFLLPLAAGGSMHGTTLVNPPWSHCLGLHRVTQFHLDIYSGYRDKFDDPKGLFCTKLKSKDDPKKESDDDELTVYGLNSGKSEIIYNKSLTSIGIVGGLGRGLKQFDHPVSLTGDSDGNLFVADTGNDRIVHLRYGDDELIGVKEIVLGKKKGFEHPTGISLSGGKLYVADRDNNRLVVLTEEGEFLREIIPSHGTDRLYKPYTVAAISEGDGWCYYRDYYIAVVDSLGQRLWKLTLEGEPVRVVHYSSVYHGGAFGHVAIDYYGNVYVTDRENGAIHKFDRFLNYVVSIRGSDLDQPRGITIYRRFGQIFVSERSGAQYFWVGTDVTRFEADSLRYYPDKEKGSIDVSFLLTEHSDISIELVSDDSKIRIPVLVDYVLPLGHVHKRIYFNIPHNTDFANCKYVVKLKAVPTYSSRAYHSSERLSRKLNPTTM
ncbi:MAG: hypothetical protein B6D63_06250 [Candidatus Latescibacteria bacterium 4484_7]|nr:MAG: hypothetical protein B6D63_06250 [Candidatus Latescibacteria bacterium 4484_7]